MVVLILGLIASAVASYFDYTSSLGKREVNILVRGKDGRISLKQYVLWQSIFTGEFLLFPLLLGYPLWVAGVMQFANAGIKVFAFLHNRKVQA